MKTSYIIIVVVVAVAIFTGSLLFFRSRNTDQNPGGSPLVTTQPGATVPLDPGTIPSSEKITLGTARGSVEVNNFYKVAVGSDGDALIIKAAPEYQIIYNGEISAFGIYITGGTVSNVLKSAENNLLAVLGVSQAQACSLNISWSVSSGADKNMSGQSYPLSFCTPGVQ